MSEFYREAHKDMTEQERLQNQKVRQLNDLMRTNMPASLVGSKNRAVFSGSLTGADTEFKNAALNAVRDFRAFTEGNDPYGEHDMGTVEVGGEQIMFKFDYYAPDLMHGSEQPWNAAETVRFLSIFYAGDY